MDKNKKVGGFKILKMNETYVPPTTKINKKYNFIEWGDKNKYPDYLLNLYNNQGTALHKAIINKKQKMTSGNGFNDIQDEELLTFIKKNKLELEVKKIDLDLEIFNQFALEVVYTNDGSIYSVKHVPVQKLRMGIRTEEMDFDYLWFSHDWKQIKKEQYKPEAIRLYNPYVKKGKCIYFYTEYNPDCEVYGIPSYSTSINWIELGYEISKFHLNQAKQGYAPSFILNFATGIPSDEEMEDFARQFESEYSGTENAGKIIITYSEGMEQRPELTAVQLNDSDDRFIALNEEIQENITMASEIPPQLVILTPGKLGSTDERTALMDEFYNSYIKYRQHTLESVINEILSSDFEEEITLKKYNEE